MDSQTSLKVNNLQRDLLSLEDKEKRLEKELEDIRAQIKVVRMEIDTIMADDRIANDILERVYEQRRSVDSGKRPKK